MPPTISIYAKLEQERTTRLKDQAYEYLNLLAIVYGDYILSGDRPIRSYWHMTMADIESELTIRAKVYKARADKLQTNLDKKQRAEEDAFVNELRQLQ